LNDCPQRKNKEVRAMLKKLLMMALVVMAFSLPAHAAEAAHESQPGLLDLNLTSIIWVLVIFIVVAVILYRTAWKNVLAGLKGREERIRKDISDAEAARSKAEATLQEYNKQLATAEQKARDLLNKATADAESLATQIRARAQQESEETKERAVKEIEVARDQALSEIYQQVADLSTRVAEKIIRRNLNADDQRDLVNQSLQELQTAH
jgi:F-type H+-transporting ATPase subunit b